MAWGRCWPLAPALVLFALLAAVGDRYGLSRDELYFIEAGHHPALAYPDQPALVPLLARVWWSAVGGSLEAFRLVPALVAALVVVVAALTAGELGGSSTSERLVAAAATASSSTVVAVGHLFSTTTFDALGTALSVWLLLRALRRRGAADWLLLGAAVGLALEVKLLPLLVLGCCGAAVLVCGPRAALASPWPWAGAVLAAVLAAPVVVWQSAHGWPQLAVSRSIAAGSSGTSTSRWLVVPLQVLLVGPLVLPLLVVGVVALWRSAHRWLVVAAALLLVAVVVGGGKPYYTLGLVPALLAASASPTVRWVRRHPQRRRRRAGGVALLLVLNLLGGASVVLPWLPVRDAQPLVAANYDTGEQVGWPELVDAVQQVAAPLPPGTVVLTANYGEAGALAMARRNGLPLPPVYSGHDAFADWGPPPTSATTVVVVGAVRPRVVDRCRVLTHLTNRADITNDEAGQPVAVCHHSGSWRRDWPRLRHLG